MGGKSRCGCYGQKLALYCSLGRAEMSLPVPRMLKNASCYLPLSLSAETSNTLVSTSVVVVVVVVAGVFLFCCGCASVWRCDPCCQILPVPAALPSELPPVSSGRTSSRRAITVTAHPTIYNAEHHQHFIQPQPCLLATAIMVTFEEYLVAADECVEIGRAHV